MCGIAGAWGSDSAAAIRPITRSMAHRGPDGEGFWQHPQLPLHLGHRRLSVIDHSGGSQPMQCDSPDLVITFNGEIYNHQELRSTLEQCGHLFKSSHSDTEVLLRAYAEWGPDMVHRLNGMWAFCIVDLLQQKCFLSRDRFGQKPLYYARGRDWFAFASELKSLALHPKIDGSISEAGLVKFLAYSYIPAPHTYYSNVYKLPAGHQLFFEINSQTAHTESYWSLHFETDARLEQASEAAVGEEFYGLLQQAVQRRLLADVPVGTFLSGGIDSSAVSTLAAHQLKETQQLKTFSIAFDEASFDESDYARSMASFLRSDHTCETCSLATSRELLPQIISGLDEPLGDPSLLPSYLVSGIASHKVSVALGGDGADELLCGYDPFRALAPAEWYTRFIPSPLRHAIYSAVQYLPVSHRNISLDFKLKRTLRGLKYRPELWAPLWMAPLDMQELSHLAGRSLDPDEVFCEAIQAWNTGMESGSRTDALSQYFIRCYLQDNILPKIDRSAMLHSLEPRSPFLDIDLVNFIRKLPARYRYRGNTSKWILRYALKNNMPQKILQRPKKGFGIPIGEWFRNGSLHFPSQAPHPSIDSSYMQRLHSNHQTGKSDQRQCLWNLWLLSAWKTNNS